MDTASAALMLGPMLAGILTGLGGSTLRIPRLAIAFCGGLAMLLVHILGVDPLTAYLATSPGGVDSVAIIASSTKVDVSFVMAMQTVRFMLILLVGPSLSRFVAGLFDKDGCHEADLSPASIQEIESRAAEEDIGDLD